MPIKRIILFPGLGADERLFSGLDLIGPRQLVDYHAFDFNKDEDDLILEVINKYDITGNDILIASSFGGILASRIQHRLSCDNLILLGSMCNMSEVGFFNKLALSSGIWKIIDLKNLPSVFIRFAFGLRNQNAVGIFKSMLDKYEFSEIKSMISFLRKTKPILIVPKKRIHGRFDMLIKQPVGKVDWIDLGHIFTMKENLSEDDMIRVNRMLA